MKSFIIFFFGVFISITTYAQTYIYVSPSGNDKWSNLHETAIGAGGPLATIPAAINKVREHYLRNNSENDFHIILRAGTYHISELIKITEKDQFRLSFEAYPGEKPVISAGRKINGWKKSKINGVACWKINLPDVKNGNYYFRQLFVNGQRASPYLTDSMIVLIYKNIILVNDKCVYRTRDEASIFEPGFWSDLNVIWNIGKEGLKVEWPFGFGKPSVFGTFEEWIEKTGNDRHSLIQDPLLKDPLNGDFTISPNSIIHKLHIDPGTFEDVGPRPKEKWELTQVKQSEKEISKIGHVE